MRFPLLFYETLNLTTFIEDGMQFYNCFLLRADAHRVRSICLGMDY